MTEHPLFEDEAPLPDISDLIEAAGIPKGLTTERGVEVCCEILERSEGYHDLKYRWETEISPAYQRHPKVRATKDRLKRSYD